MKNLTTLNFQVPDELERRAFAVNEFRVEQRDGKPIIEGHAAVFNQKADIFGFTEEIAPGAFRDSIGTDDIRALFNHDSNFVLGRNRAKTLELSEDEHGLFISNRPPDTQWARDLLVSLQRGDISQMSFGFRTIEDEWKTVDGMPHRTLKRVQLFDVSPVTFPAYPQTDVGVAMRSLGKWLKREGKDAEASAKAEAEALAAAAARDRELQLKR
ncbi:MAG TPA: HK97 family phage prohead protease [Anaerolineales bacterium]|nr:HK97 family phage prohead protease [Anaerolineales bacterium]